MFHGVGIFRFDLSLASLRSRSLSRETKPYKNIGFENLLQERPGGFRRPSVGLPGASVTLPEAPGAHPEPNQKNDQPKNDTGAK